MAEEGFDLQVCLRSVRQGDEDAARALMTHLYPLVLKIVRSHLPRRTSEEDLVQAVFIKIFTRLEQFSGSVPLEHWVSRITVNTCLHQIAKEKVRPEVRWADLSEVEEDVVRNLMASQNELSVSDSLASQEIVTKLLETLNAEDRLVITLVHLEGKTLQEVRELTGWSLPLVKIRAFRARKKMKNQLEKLMRTKEPNG